MVREFNCLLPCKTNIHTAISSQDTFLFARKKLIFVKPACVERDIVILVLFENHKCSGFREYVIGMNLNTGVHVHFSRVDVKFDPILLSIVFH